jgi:hypothetical protein
MTISSGSGAHGNHSSGGINDFGWGAQCGATLRLDENSEDYARGDVHRITAWGSYRFTDWISGSVRVAGETMGAIDGIDSNIVGPVQTADPDTYGGERFGIEAVVPVYQDLNGPQMQQDWSLATRIALTF